jgi:hypothetical protein
MIKMKENTENAVFSSNIRKNAIIYVYSIKIEGIEQITNNIRKEMGRQLVAPPDYWS